MTRASSNLVCRRTSRPLWCVCPEMSVPTTRDDVGFVVEPEPVMLAQNLPGSIERKAALSHLRQPVVFNLGDVYRRIPGRKGRRGPDRSGDLIGQSFHIIAEDRTVIRIGVKVKVAPGGTQLVLHGAQNFVTAHRKRIFSRPDRLDHFEARILSTGANSN